MVTSRHSMNAITGIKISFYKTKVLRVSHRRKNINYLYIYNHGSQVIPQCPSSSHRCDSNVTIFQQLRHKLPDCVTAYVYVPSTYWGIIDLILLGPCPRLVPVCGVRGLLPGCSLIGSILGLSSLMGLFAALLWTQTHLKSQQWQKGHQETHVPAW